MEQIKGWMHKSACPEGSICGLMPGAYGKCHVLLLEAFRSDSAERNFLRLFGTKEMAEKYGIRGKEVIDSLIKEDCKGYTAHTELCRNFMAENPYYISKYILELFPALEKLFPHGYPGEKGLP